MSRTYDLLRSALAIALRHGHRTNWAQFGADVQVCLADNGYRQATTMSYRLPDSGPFILTGSEARTLCELPDALRTLADHVDAQAVAADAAGLLDAVHGYRARAALIREEAERLT